MRTKQKQFYPTYIELMKINSYFYIGETSYYIGYWNQPDGGIIIALNQESGRNEEFKYGTTVNQLTN